MLTQAQTWQGGSVWQGTKIDLNQPFDFAFNVFLGCQDEAGADGIVFMLQPLSTSLGVSGGGLGFQGVSPSIGIALDTWQNIEPTENDNDPAYDHISIQANGVTVHGNDLAGPVQASATSPNIEDCAWHVFRIKWEPDTHTLSTYFDGVFRLSATKDIVAEIFHNDPMVYWGFSASTGGSYNIQKFCTALNPVFSSGLVNDGICFGSPVTFKDSSTSFTAIKSYYWDLGDGTTSTLADPPQHSYAQVGEYRVKHTITGFDGCVSDTLVKIIRIGDPPKVSFAIADTCRLLQPRTEVKAEVQVGSVAEWHWTVNGNAFSDNKIPDFSTLGTGTYGVALKAVSDVGCVSDTYSSSFHILPFPEAAMEADNGCLNIPLPFTGVQTDNSTVINKWLWDFGDGEKADKKNVQHAFARPGTFPVQLEVAATNGCTHTITKDVLISQVQASAGKDTVVLAHTVFQLHGSGGVRYEWSPSAGLTDPHLPDPQGNIAEDMVYTLTAEDAQGCRDAASVKVTVFKGASIFVPNAFTPNHDGLNDVLKPYYDGIQSLQYFDIYNRFGQKIFTTRDMNKGWDGYFKNRILPGMYSWVLGATDLIGRMHQMKGSVLLIK